MRDGKGRDDEEEAEAEAEDGEEMMGVKASSGPREGVEAVREPEGWAVKKVPLPLSFTPRTQGMIASALGARMLAGLTSYFAD